MKRKNKGNIVPFMLKRSSSYFASVILLFIFIGVLTTISPAYRFSSNTVTEWTSKIDSTTFLFLMGMENKAFQEAFPQDKVPPDVSSTLFEIATSIKPNDPRSLLGNEIPGFSIFDNRILIAGEGTNYTNLPVESSPPLEEVLKDREAVVDGEDEQAADKEEQGKNKASTGDKNIVFIYNTHNRESFLPHLPGVSNPDDAHHKEVNVTKISERLAKGLRNEGIGTIVDQTDIMNMLNDKGWKYGMSYKASREVVKEALATNKDFQYAFDIHRDAQPRKTTTKNINGKDYARIMIVIGEEYASYEKNLQLATKLHYLLEKKYPGLSRGILPKKGAGTNGVFNQDLSENAILLEFGGVENNMDELYRSADALADVFSDFYWDAEKVSN
ncbi:MULTISPECIES: stage II sporulation protein P [unclassified Virgibacillus]|uniref:stage II sporulation protein P n=1 Tax=unclassified Virgibacillus TaxID=2620237 RepID=UPI0024DE64D6|nr:stage II sporulation protein P [Virgibacillus sp. LDC-1]